MSRIDTISDLDDSASTLPAVSFSVAGFPTTNLQALYLFEDGSVGSTPTTALDSSGNGNNAPIVTGSTATRIAGGIKTGDALNNGALFQTPLAYSGSFTLIGVVRSRVPVSTTNSFPVIHTSSGSYSASGVGASVGVTGSSTRGVFLVNNDCTSASDQIDFSTYNTTTSGGIWAGAPSSRPRTTALTPRQTWTAFALSVNISTGEIILRSNGSTVTFTALADLTTYLAGAGYHAFGYSRYVSANTAMGDLGLFGIYSGASNVAALDALITAAKSRMAIRGVAVV